MVAAAAEVQESAATHGPRIAARESRFDPEFSQAKLLSVGLVYFYRLPIDRRQRYI